MILTTAGTLQDHELLEVKGLVTGHIAAGINVIGDGMTKITDFLGGRSATFEKAFESAERKAVEVMMEKAQESGANAIVGIRLDYEIMTLKGHMLVVCTYGTAVRVRPLSSDERRPHAQLPAQSHGSDDRTDKTPSTGRAIANAEQRGRYDRNVDAEIAERSGPGHWDPK